ncbi:NCS2 family permease [Candidatus Methanomassiliicoccus intestinalis]|jgi:xanthine/uracil/vitamin C permease|uniref:Xanthine/uracil/vitamin C permease n=1 Tax=Methanomassiliicoccus intestinalis (strain Issoire-Mx1) TaxID=1295009 RepID=R9T4C8_METII|nr:NCS2 family permease [Candidatus Methanomassiliicoccus intestinalis]AGN25762.1 xanthine/uracil/vitamin C permease [Candidatus Methanomassiliicoccus intestinalis Issoire-Mx1]
MFKLKENNTSVRTEIIAGFTTFFAMSYIIFVNPDMLKITGMDFASVMIATCVASAIGSFLTAFIANIPFAQAPGMGLNALFTFTLCQGMGYTWNQALAIVFISGVIFLIITISPLRSRIIEAIPKSLKSAIAAGIGLFIAFIGMLNSGLVVVNGASNVTDLGSFSNGSVLLVVIGLIITGVLMAWKVKGSIFIGIIATTIIGIPLGVTDIPTTITYSNFSLAPTFLQLDFNLLSAGILPLLTAIITLTMVDMFDTVGTLVGTANASGMADENGNFKRGDKALVADALATCAGALVGTSTVSTYMESSTGIKEGGRTGLTSVVVGLLFLAAILLGPIALMIPSAATAPALIIVGVSMMSAIKNIDWHDFEIALPCFLTIAVMPFAYSISDGIGFGFIAYTIIKVCRGKAKEVPLLMYAISILFILMYAISAYSSY